MGRYKIQVLTKNGIIIFNKYCLGDRLMVGQRTLDPFIQVRILVSQPFLDMTQEHNETINPSGLIVITKIDLPPNIPSIHWGFNQHAEQVRKEINNPKTKPSGLLDFRMFMAGGNGYTIQIWDNRESTLKYLKKSLAHKRAVEFARENNLPTITTSYNGNELPDSKEIEQKLQEEKQRRKLPTLV